MTARADISNHRRKKLEERYQRRLAAWEKEIDANEEVYHHCPHCAGVLSRETAWEKGEAKPPFYREVLEEGVRRGDVVWGKEFDAMREYARGSEGCADELQVQLREAEGRIERAIGVLDDRAGIHYIDVIRSALSILAGTEKERDG